MNFQPFITSLIALQFVAFGWRINREISLEDKNRKVWLPAPDYINVVSLLTVAGLCVVRPIVTGAFDTIARTALAAGFVFIVFHPISMAAHYRLFSRLGRSIYLNRAGGDYPWITGQECVSVLLSIVVACATAYLTWHSQSFK